MISQHVAVCSEVPPTLPDMGGGHLSVLEYHIKRYINFNYYYYYYYYLRHPA